MTACLLSLALCLADPVGRPSVTTFVAYAADANHTPPTVARPVPPSREPASGRYGKGAP